MSKYFKLEEYEKLREPSVKEKNEIWKIAIGLQEVDGLKPSDFLLQKAEENVLGKLSLDSVRDLINEYYEKSESSTENNRTKEADKVSYRIAKILSEKTFNFSVIEYISIHKQLFDEIYEFAGKIRDFNISKKEWILDNKSVVYSNWGEIQETLEYDFKVEKAFDYSVLSIDEKIEHIANFISNIWQIHAFGEGNTRTTAVFIIRYLRVLGFPINNDLFSDHSWYFRNALVRANYSDAKNNIFSTNKYLILFLENLLNGENHKLQNRHMHIHYDVTKEIKSGTINKENVTKEIKSGTINKENVTKESKSDTINNHILSVILENPSITLEELSMKINVNIRTIKRRVKYLKMNNFLTREGGNKFGKWIVKK